MRSSKKEYFHKNFHKIKSNIKRTWKVINSLLKPKSVLKKSQITSIIEGDIEYSYPQDIENALNSFYAPDGRNISNSFDSDNHYTASSSIVSSFYFELTTDSEIY